MLDNLNALILDQCKICLDRDKAFNEEYSSLDVEKEIEQLNPTLRKAVHMLTRSTSEIKHKEVMSEEQQKKKKLRRYFLLRLMLFCTDDRCSMPMHLLIADLIESQGGTAFLIQELNKLGVCSSQETLKRFIQSKVDTKVGKHPCQTFFNCDSFTVVSVDNIDFLYIASQGYIKVPRKAAGMELLYR